VATPIPDNCAVFSLRQIVEVTGAQLSGCGDGDVSGVTTDSRSDTSGKLFVALSGDRFDGHDYLHDVVDRGARAVIVERDTLLELPVPILRVDSTLRALGSIARLHRNRWNGKVIAIAGSAGKTTTRVATQALLEAIYPGSVHATPGNLNNQVGVPMTLLGLTDQHNYAVIEVGTNFPGEVRALAEVCQPDVAVLTLIGLEHTEGLGDLDGIEAEEGDIFGILAPGSVAIGNGDDRRVVRQLARRALQARQVTYGCEQFVDYSATHQPGQHIDTTSIGIQRSERTGGGRLVFESTLLGKPGALAAAAAVAVAESLGPPIDDARVGQALFRNNLGEAGRLIVLKLNEGIVVVDDCYNANPPSMTSSIAVATELAERRQSRLILVLGEMRELGPHSEREHRILGNKLGAASVVVAVGQQTQPLFDSARSAGVPSEYFSNADEAGVRIADLAEPGDVVLVKGSRGVKLEVVVRALAAKKGYAA